VRLEIDHVIPWAGGGRTTLWNCMSLCPSCNGIKLNYSRDRDGYEHYAGNRNWIPQARRVLAREKRHRLNPLRWVRAAWALGS
jgi:5-methylcytosine-specific restriction endonuclease McrA